MIKSNVLLVVFVFSLAACSKGTVSGTTGTQPPQTAAPATQSASGNLTFTAPESWVVEKTSSNMRIAQYKLPKDGGDTEDASLVLYYFGQGQGGGTQANIDRWISQIHQADGSDSKDKAKSETLTVNGLKVTMVDVSGTYSAEMSPGSGEFTSKPNYRLRGAVIETPKGSYFAKLTGPEKTLAHWDQAFRDYVNSFQFK
ncbi:MAG TPA: hypothetical protein VLA93_02100 [Pyrinomonadaceae bacterium]|nr:hypothetical protein [Pyrinomonadaceae bacterium]